MTEAIEVREVTGASFARGKSKQDYRTPREFLRAVEFRFGTIQFDLAASERYVCAEFFSEADDALKQKWPTDKLCWLNPPFGNIAPWARKCGEEARLFGVRVLLLVPASIGSNWYWHNCAPHAHTLCLHPRLTFVGAHDPYPKDLMLCAFGPDKRGQVDRWIWR